MSKTTRTRATIVVACALSLSCAATYAKQVSVTAVASQGNPVDTITVSFVFDDAAPLTFSSANTSQATLSAPLPAMQITSTLGLDLTLPIASITVQNDLIPATDDSTLGVRDRINVFAIAADSTQSANLLLQDFLAVGTGNDPNDALASPSIPDAFAALVLDPFVRNEPWSRGLIGLNGNISRQAELESIVATPVPLPPAGLLMLTACGWLFRTPRGQFPRAGAQRRAR